ncbi:MAG TPA: SIMPL domain-containing protein [Vicinamibacterales bacterium]|nr:SIMPL domain-containing protein [Vicinamibacterales bacterium]
MRLHTVGVVLLSMLVTSSVYGQGTATPAEPVVVVSGEGLIKVAPDLAWVTFAVERRSKDPKDAQMQNAKVMTAVQTRLIAAAVPKDAIRTLSYDLHLQSDWVDGKQVPRGYVARNTIEVRLDDITRVGEIIDLAITSGANSVHGVRFDVKERDALEREALKRATADARARAEAAASGIGGAIGRVLRIEEPSRGYPVPPPVPMMREALMAQDGRATTPVVAGEIEIRSTVVLTAMLK